MEMRLQKFMAHAGVCSRRHAERMIMEGRVAVNGLVVTEAGVKVDPARDLVKVDSRKVVIDSSVSHEYWLLYKPVSVLSTVKDPMGRSTVMDYFRDLHGKRIYPVGRLDFDSEGLILLTDDGELANRMLHPRYKLEKTYHVTVKGHPSGQDVARLEKGVFLENRKTMPCSITLLGKTRRNSTLKVILREGRKRQIRRMFDMVNHKVIRLLRVSTGPLNIRGMKPGEKRPLTSKEIKTLKEMCGLKLFANLQKQAVSSQPTGVLQKQ